MPRPGHPAMRVTSPPRGPLRRVVSAPMPGVRGSRPLPNTTRLQPPPRRILPGLRSRGTPEIPLLVTRARHRTAPAENHQYTLALELRNACYNCADAGGCFAWDTNRLRPLQRERSSHRPTRSPVRANEGGRAGECGRRAGLASKPAETSPPAGSLSAQTISSKQASRRSRANLQRQLAVQLSGNL